ncbi:uncharacterized protein LOC121647518 [Melanotaenia boesemani]|uniref:uncharacterized protein LOC121647518 n=1 Tax=Melanotaenia boesemani TaxID=1250792 RepID=UPI001C043B6B|nr:uncharacterized protein LOC121647518 [Melanotaenia boesemani]
MEGFSQQDPDQNSDQSQGLKLDQGQQSLLSLPADEDDGDKKLTDHHPDVVPVQMKDQEIDQGPRDEQVQDFEEGGPNLDQNRAEPPHTVLDPTAETANQDEARESGGGVPALVVTEVEESRQAAAPQRASRPADLVIPAATSITSPTSSIHGGDMICCDLLSPRSDSFSLTSEPTVSRRSEDDDTRSITASSVMSLFHRVQLDPLEKDWMRSCALGKVAAQRLLLAQEPGLVLKKDFITNLRRADRCLPQPPFLPSDPSLRV